MGYCAVSRLPDVDGDSAEFRAAEVVCGFDGMPLCRRGGGAFRGGRFILRAATDVFLGHDCRPAQFVASREPRGDEGDR